MAVPAWRRNRSKLDAEYEAVKFRVIVTQMIMRNFGLKVDKNKYKPLVSQRLRQQYPDLKKFFDKVEKYQDNVEASMELKEYDKWFIRKVRNRLYDYIADLIKIINAMNKENDYVQQIN